MEGVNLKTLLAMNGIRHSVIKDLADHGIRNTGQLGRKWRREKADLDFLFHLRYVNKASITKVLDSAAQVYVNSILGKEEEAAFNHTPRADPNRTTTPSIPKKKLEDPAAASTVFRVTQQPETPPSVSTPQATNNLKGQRFQPVLNGLSPIVATPSYPQIDPPYRPLTPEIIEGDTKRRPFSTPSISFKEEVAFSPRGTDSTYAVLSNMEQLTPTQGIDRGGIRSRYAGADEHKDFSLDRGSYREPRSMQLKVPNKLSDEEPPNGGWTRKVSLRKAPQPAARGEEVTTDVKDEVREDVQYEKLRKKLERLERETMKQREEHEGLVKEAMRQREEHERLAREAMKEREKHEKLMRQARRLAESEEHERLVREGKQREEHERLAREAKQREEHERLVREAKQREEHERLVREAEQREQHERLAREAEQREQHERLAREAKQREEHERLVREAKQREEHERLVREAKQREEHERLVREAKQREEHERLVREAKQREEHERLVREAKQREEHERLVREAKQREEHERLVREAKQREEHERLVREGKQREEHERLAREASQREENERLVREAKQREEHERLAREAKQREEHERLVREAKQREEHERLVREAKQREQHERLAREARQREENERLAREAKQREEHERLVREAKQREEHERLVREAKQHEDERLAREANQCEKHERLVREAEQPRQSALSAFLHFHQQAPDAIARCEKLGFVTLNELIQAKESMLEGLLKELKAIPRKKFEAFLKAAREGTIVDRIGEVSSIAATPGAAPPNPQSSSPPIHSLINQEIASSDPASQLKEEFFEDLSGEFIIMEEEKSLKKDELIQEFERENQIIEDISNLIVNETEYFTKAALEVLTQSKVNHQERAKRLKRLIQKAGGKTPLRGGVSSTTPETVTSDRREYMRRKKTINFRPDVIIYSLRSSSTHIVEESKGKLKPGKYDSLHSSGMTSSDIDQVERLKISTEEKRLQEKHRIEELEKQKPVITSHCWSCSVCHKSNELNRSNCADCFTSRVKVPIERSLSSGRYQTRSRQDMPPLVNSLTDSNVKISSSSNLFILACAACNKKYQCNSKDARCQICYKFLIEWTAF